MKTISLVLLMTLFLLSACASGGSTSLAALYAGDKNEGWYYFSKNCSATLCPPR